MCVRLAGRVSWKSIFYIHTIQVVLLTAFLFTSCFALDCFKCSSVAGEYPPCDDPFHNNYTQDILESPCWAGRKQRDGVFPATSCVKLAGIYDDTGETLVVRGCAVDSGTLTIDTELVRMSHCGGFYYEDRYVRGCVQNCLEDGCNDGKILSAFGKHGLLTAAGFCMLHIFLYKYVTYF